MKSTIIEYLEEIKDYNQVYKIPRNIFMGKRVNKKYHL